MNYEKAEKILSALNREGYDKTLEEYFNSETIINVISEASDIIASDNVKITITGDTKSFFDAICIDKDGKLSKDIKSNVIYADEEINLPACVFMSAMSHNQMNCKQLPVINSSQMIFIQTIYQNDKMLYNLVFYSDKIENIFSVEM